YWARDLVDDVDRRPLDLDAEAVDLEDAHRSPPRSRPIAARERPSPTRLVPIVSSAIAITGMTAPHGWIVRPCRFSLIIRPQSAAGGWRPKPRKLRPAIRPIEYVRRRLASTMSGLVSIGRISPKRSLDRDS